MNNPRKYRGSNRGSYSRQKLDFQTGGTCCLGAGGTTDPFMNVTSLELRLMSHPRIIHESFMNMNFDEYEFMNYS